MGKTEKKSIYFKLEGAPRIKPQAFSGKDIATIILNLEDSLRAVAKDQNPELDEEFLTISLVEIRHESAGLRFIPSFPQVSAAFIFLASCIEQDSLEKVPNRAIDSLKEIQKVIIHKENCVGSFISGRKKITQLTSNTKLNVKAPAIINGETTLFGEIQRIGGAEPKVVLRLHTGELLSLDVSEEIARSFGNRLYTEVGLRGFATWSYPNNKLLSFKVISLTDFEDTPIDVAIDELKGSIGRYWDEIEDIKGALLIDS